MDLILSWRPLAFTYVLWSALWLGGPALDTSGTLTFGMWCGMVSVPFAFLPIILVGREDKFKAGALACSLPVSRDAIVRRNDAAITAYAARVPPPWLLKPRSQAAAIGIRRVHDHTELWQAIDALGDERSFYLLERFVPGDVYHVDSVIPDGRVAFAACHKYGRPPWEVAHQGGVFTTRMLPRDGAEAQGLVSLNARVIEALGLVRGVSHTEFIREHEDGRYHFLETSARVGGAHIVDVVEAASGINLWREWARLEIAGEDGHYRVPEPTPGYAGLVLSLARQEEPDTSAYTDPEIVMRIRKAHHAGLVVASPDPARVEALLVDYVRRFGDDFLASLPAPSRPRS